MLLNRRKSEPSLSHVAVSVCRQSPVRFPLIKTLTTLQMVAPELSLCVSVWDLCVRTRFKVKLISIPLTLGELAARTPLFLPTLIPALLSGPVRWTTNHTRYSSLMDRRRAQSLRQSAVRITCTREYRTPTRSSTLPPSLRALLVL